MWLISETVGLILDQVTYLWQLGSLLFIIPWLLVELLCNFALEEEPLYFYESRYGEVALAWFRSVYASSYDGKETFLQSWKVSMSH